MLRLLKMKMSGLDPGVRRMIRLHQGDMLRFSPPIRYPMAILAYNSLQELETLADLILCFKNAHACLRDGGYFLLTVGMIHWNRYRDGKNYVVDWFDAPAVDVDSGISVGSRSISHLDPKGNRIVLKEIFIIHRGDRCEERVEVVHFVPLLTASEYCLMLENAGFDVRSYSGYDERPEDGSSPIRCFVAQKGSYLPGRSNSQEGQN
jgi:hypothetical protein